MKPPPNLVTGKSAGAGIAKLLQAEGPIVVSPGSGPLPRTIEEWERIAHGDDEIELTLPWPPSMNAYWGLRITKTGQRIMVVTKQGTAYQKLVASLVALRWRRPPIDYRIAMLIEAWAPSDQYAEGARWEWDVDNRVKPLQDSLAKAGVLVNDKLIRDVRIVDRGIAPPGRVVVSIRRFRPGG
jgi:crossover junction endodeoxyribonuclease RusA